MKQTGYILLLGSSLLLAACSGPRGGAADPYADPGTPPPPVITDPTVAPAVRLSEPDPSGLITINVAGMAAAGGSLRTADLRDAFTVVEDGIVKGITVEAIGGGTRAGADIAFVLDTTGSMSSQIAGVRDSIISFADFLDSSGLDVQLSAVTFGDAFDTVREGSSSSGSSLGGSVPPSFDRNERPTLALTADIGAFQGFIGEQRATGGAGAPENALGALQFAYENLDWRPAAQCILVVITDQVAWTDVSNTDGIPADSRWYPPAPADVLAQVRGDCVVHVIAAHFDPDRLDDSRYSMAGLTGPEATGGVFTELTSGLDLTELPLGDVLASGHVIRYRGTVDGSEHSVRVVVDDGDLRGETTVNAVY